MKKGSQEERYLSKRGNHANIQTMVEHLKDLFESKQNPNIILALQLLEGGGVPKGLITYLFALKEWHGDQQISQKAKILFEKSASISLRRFLRTKWKKEYKQEYNEVKVSEFLSEITHHPEIDKRVLGLFCLYLCTKGGKFCLEEQLAPNEYILGELIRGNELYLANYELEALPHEIGHFPFLKVLNISGNHFCELPAEIYQLPHLESLYFVRTPLSARTLRALERAFPLIFSSKYYYEACDLKSEEEMFKASLLFLKSLYLNADFAEAWYQLGTTSSSIGRNFLATRALLEAEKQYQVRLTQNPSKASDWFGRACVQAFRQQRLKAYEYLEKSIQINPSYRTQAAVEEVFASWIEEEDFQKLLSW